MACTPGVRVDTKAGLVPEEASGNSAAFSVTVPKLVGLPVPSVRHEG